MSCRAIAFLLTLYRQFQNHIIMTQRIFTVTRRFTVIDHYSFNLDELTQEINESGWTIKQIISTSFTHKIIGGGEYPVLAITVLVEKEE